MFNKLKIKLKKEENKKDIINIMIMFIVVLIILAPMCFNDYYWNHDSPIHIANVVVLTDQIKINFFNPSKIVGLIANNFGYGSSLFYPPLAHTLVSYLNYFINNVSWSFHIMYIVAFVLSGISMYFLSKKLSKNQTIALFSGLIYMLFPYHLSDMYIRDNLSETFLFVFMPMIISALYELFNGDKNKFYLLFVVGYVGGVFSHMTVMVYFTVVIGLYLLYHYKDTWKNIKYFLIASIFILGICSPFLCTVIEHKLFGNYTVFIPGIMNQKIEWTGLWPWQYFNIFENYGNNQIKYFIDLVSIVLLVITFINYKKIKKNKFYSFVLYLGIASFFMSSKLFPWDLLPTSFSIIQFSWRIESFLAIAVALLAPLCFNLLKKKNNIILYGALIVVMILFAYPNLKFASNVKINFNNLDYNAGMGWQKEYLPANTYNTYSYFENRKSGIIIKAGSGNITNYVDNMPNLSFDIDTNYGVSVELPRLFYLGYKLKDSNGKEINLYENRHGFITADIQSTGSYTLEYVGTKTDNICDYISLIGILGFIVWRIYEKNKYSSSLL